MKIPEYETLSPELVERMQYEKATGTFEKLGFDESTAIRRYPPSRGKSSLLRSTFMQDTDKILYCPFYNRYADKTQVFPLYRNDDITRRGLHVQLVSRVARTIGAALNLNLNLIDAISLGHDIGHPPFAHSGEKYLDELSFSRSGRHFSHNIHSVRVLDGIFQYNMSLQTLIGIACHNGELLVDELHPKKLDSFGEFDALMRSCTEDRKHISELIPSTLEGCVVRFSDIIAYLGKDRQDADRAGFLSESAFGNSAIGSINAEIINNLEINIIENSYGKPYIRMDRRHFDAMISALHEADDGAALRQVQRGSAHRQQEVADLQTSHRLRQRRALQAEGALRGHRPRPACRRLSCQHDRRLLHRHLRASLPRPPLHRQLQGIFR